MVLGVPILKHFRVFPINALIVVDFYLIFSATVKILKFGTPQTIAIIVLKIEKFDVTLH